MSKRTFMIGIPSKYDTYEDWIADHDRKVRKKVIQEIEDKISEITWYHIHNGKLVEGANNQYHEPLYKYSDIKDMFEREKKKNEKS